MIEILCTCIDTYSPDIEPKHRTKEDAMVTMTLDELEKALRSWSCLLLFNPREPNTAAVAYTPKQKAARFLVCNLKVDNTHAHLTKPLADLLVEGLVKIRADFATQVTAIDGILASNV